MRPPNKSQITYERIQVYDEWIKGEIELVELAENRRTGFKNDDGSEKFADQVRFKFILEGHKYPHRSRWMGYSFGEKSNLYKKFLSYLVEGAQPDMTLDLDLFKKFKVKTMWSQNGDFDNLEQVRPIGAKLAAGDVEPPEEDVPEEVGDSPGVGE